MRNGLIDYGRFVAALGIVWFHTMAPGQRLAYIALPFFLVLLALPSRSGIVARARRLLVPFILWSLIYGLVRIVFALKNGAEPFGWWQSNMLVAGTSIHLWFLPFAFLVAFFSPLFRESSVALVLPIMAALLTGLVDHSLTEPWGQWVFGLIPALIGVAYFRAGRLALLPLVASVTILAVLRPSPDNITILVGSALAIVALSISLEPTRFSAWCARVSMWVYLGHVLVIIAGQTLNLYGFELGFFSLAGSIAFAMSIDFMLRNGNRLRRLFVSVK